MHTSEGTLQRWECLAPDGSSHTFSGEVVEAAKPARRTRAREDGVRCPDPRHVDVVIAARGTRQSKAGTWARFRCTQPDGTAHHFQVLVEVEGEAVSGRRPPGCPFHEGSKVVRHGVYGTGSTRRQRYRCLPENGETPHTFTPPLSREAVLEGHDACATCEELLSPHRGRLTAARHTPWSLATYARALSELSLGSSYSSVSQWMRLQRETEQRHLAGDHVPGPVLPLAGSLDLDPALGTRSMSSVGATGRAAWHLAADLTEQYGPLLMDQLSARIRDREAAQREANDRALAERPGEPLAAPVVYMLDDVPIYHRTRRNRQQRVWFVMVVVEMLWVPGPTPMDLPRHENRLRLARAYPRNNAEGWRLVLGELGVRPDFVVADSADAIRLAVQAEWGSDVGFIPSLFHMRRNLRDRMTEDRSDTLSHVVNGRRVPVPELAKRLGQLDREELLMMTPEAWAEWWDDLVDQVRARGGPVESVLAQRRAYEDRVGAALPLMRTNPHLPASNAAVENRIRAQLDPFLTNRKQLYRNLARTNALLDLATCRAQGVFNDLDAVAATIREANEAAGGWAPQPRAVTDVQPAWPSGSTSAAAGQRYSSLLNPRLVPALVERRFGQRS